MHPYLSVVEELTLIKAELHSIPAELGLPQYRTIAIRKAVPSTAEDALEGEEALQDYILDPPCHTTRAPTKYQGMYLSEDTVVEAQTLLMVKNLPRTFSRRFLEINIQAYILDPVVNEQGLITSGNYCKLLDIIDDRTLSWRLILQLKSDHEYTAASPSITITSDP